MKQPNVLLLDLQPSPEFSSALRAILESARTSNQQPAVLAGLPTGQNAIQLQQEAFAGNELANGAGASVKELLSRLRPAVVFLVSPWEVLRQIGSQLQSLFSSSPASEVIVVSDPNTADEIFEFDQFGVSEFFTPPLKPRDILPRFWRALQRGLAGSNSDSGNSTAEPVEPFFREVLPVFKSLIGGSPAFLLQANRIPLIAKCDARVFISGETGTGKEMFARAIHRLSPRSDRPFVPLNCSAIPTELFESELFGHERGSFTGAVGKRAGLVAEADGGTLFLDEIDTLPYYSQVKLLRFLQESEYRAVGSDKNRQADVRIITATNADVARAMKEEKLRKDLYYRLNIIELKLPALRERREDIFLLANHFLSRYAEKFGKFISGFSTDAMQKLSLHDWPGNVRELEHAVERAVALAESSRVTVGDLTIGEASNELSNATSPQPFQEAKRRAVEQFERNYLQNLLETHQGNVSQAARTAQKDRGTLLQLLRKYGIKAAGFRNDSSQGEDEV